MHSGMPSRPPSSSKMAWKRLYIMRHAAASHSKQDKERSLSFEGRKQIDELLTRALGLFDQVTHVLCSTALRTRQTCIGLEEILPPRINYQFLDSLYHAPAEDILEEIRLLPVHAQDILIIGHNPGVSQFLARTAAGRDRTMGTAQIAVYDIHGLEWQTLNFQNCNLREIL
ncbi:SixA phosphatase family protein [Candidatus Odyssella thessalonicensis]|uniref:SixA phosphatase family protein n=1 Tax=Candidatus Odyssella thessalonicensis TaxID=84647 RepID=UPI000225BDB7|nr:phosphohistidine phosphatase [Candidatus Odyssella thessalonicensis]